MAWVLSGGLALLGLILLGWWAAAVFAYGVEVDEKALAPTVRPGDVVLFVLGIGCVLAAAVVPLLRMRRAQRRQERL